MSGLTPLNAAELRDWLESFVEQAKSQSNAMPSLRVVDMNNRIPMSVVRVALHYQRDGGDVQPVIYLTIEDKD